ncbi:alpha/beta hydrolase [Lentzea tibetensis]|uniref:Alpha/beta hydrolase n=1 Tax=Lentzea tibetensis TaxID=2591470 RepID=A0A563EMW7_9PSEU|nr:alpha/beta fold hydrolase [Lentzea tibetensis]TWP48492.1 alpha/beta hydrolase [Lentzea tibetensis]
MISRRTFGKVVGAGLAGAPPATFGPLNQIDAGMLNIGYVELGPPRGRPVILLHGWPYDIHSYAEVAPMLARRGHRVIVPHLRGHGTTRFRDAATVRNAQQAAFALDVIALMDALGIDKALGTAPSPASVTTSRRRRRAPSWTRCSTRAG